jgi:hypothetical protein
MQGIDMTGVPFQKMALTILGSHAGNSLLFSGGKGSKSTNGRG